MKMKISDRHSSILKSQMESIMNFVAESLAKCLRVNVCLGKGMAWLYKDILINFDDQVWKDLSEEWQKYLSEKEESPACDDAVVSREVPELNTECLRLGNSSKSE